MSRYSGIARAAVSFLRTPKGKQAGGRIVDGAAQAASRVAGEQHAARIAKAREAARRGLEKL